MAYELTEEDVQALRWMHHWIRNQSPKPRRDIEPDTLLQRPEVLVAKVPAAGIGPIVYDEPEGAGTGSGSTEPESPAPNYAECDIYRLVSIGRQPKQLVPAGFKKIIYNLGDRRIRGGAWALVNRDKFGDWYGRDTSDAEVLAMRAINHLANLSASPGAPSPNWFPAVAVDLDVGIHTYADATAPFQYDGSISAGFQSVNFDPGWDLRGVIAGAKLLVVSGNLAFFITVVEPHRDAQGVVTLSGDGVASVRVTDGGGDYSQAPVVEFDDSESGEVATGTAILSGSKVASVTIDSPASGYLRPPNVRFIPTSLSAYFSNSVGASDFWRSPPAGALWLTDGSYGLPFRQPVSDFSFPYTPVYNCHRAKFDPPAIGGPTYVSGDHPASFSNLVVTAAFAAIGVPITLSLVSAFRTDAYILADPTKIIVPTAGAYQLGGVINSPTPGTSFSLAYYNGSTNETILSFGAGQPFLSLPQFATGRSGDYFYILAGNGSVGLDDYAVSDGTLFINRIL